MIEVTTASGTVYVFDDDMTQVQRVRQGDARELRRDGDVLELMQLLDPPTIGEPMTMEIILRKDGVHTMRQTTPVTKVEKSVF